MKASAPAENKCSNFSSGNKATLPVAQMPVVVAPDKAGLMPAVVAQVEIAQVEIAPDKAGLVKVALDRLIP